MARKKIRMPMTTIIVITMTGVALTNMVTLMYCIMDVSKDLAGFDICVARRQPSTVDSSSGDKKTHHFVGFEKPEQKT